MLIHCLDLPKYLVVNFEPIDPKFDFLGVMKFASCTKFKKKVLRTSAVAQNFVFRLILGLRRLHRCYLLSSCTYILFCYRSFSQVPNALSAVLDECISFYYAQRNLQSNIVLHCDIGIGRSGLFATLMSFICEINSGKGIPDLMAALKLLSEGRKNLIKDKNHLLLAFQLGLSYVQNILIKCK